MGGWVGPAVVAAQKAPPQADVLASAGKEEIMGALGGRARRGGVVLLAHNRASGSQGLEVDLNSTGRDRMGLPHAGWAMYWPVLAWGESGGNPFCSQRHNCSLRAPPLQPPGAI